MYHDAFGVTHYFGTAATVDTGTTCLSGVHNDTASVVAPDGSGYTINTDSTGPSATVNSRSGVLINAPLQTGTGSGTVTDNNGNQITTNGYSFTDTLGTAALTVSGSGTPTSPLTYTYTLQSSSTAPPLKVNYTGYNIKTAFNCTGVTEYTSTGSINLATSVNLPDGSSYSFSYEDTPGNTGYKTGRITSVTLPTGKTINYNYSYLNSTHDAVDCSSSSTIGFDRTTPDSTTAWKYRRTAPTITGNPWVTAVTDPLGNETDYGFQGNYEVQRQVYQGSSSGTKLLTVDTCYSSTTTQPTSPCTTTAVNQPITWRMITPTLDTGAQSRKATQYNGYGLPIETDEYALGTSAVGALYRKATIVYASLGNNINDRPSSITLWDGSGNPQAQTTFSYDTATLQSSGITTQHLSVTGSRGNPTVINRYKDTTNYDSTTITYYDTGTVQQVQDPLTHLTKFAYGATSSCAGAFPTQATLPITSLTTSATWDCNTGQIATSTDVDTQKTTFTYSDPFSRLTQLDAPAGAELAVKYSVSTSSNTATVDRWLSTNANSPVPPTSDTGWRHQADIYDWAGRPIEHDLVNDPVGLSKTVSSYDALGRTASVTNPYWASTSQPSDGTTYWSYDALGRVTQ